MRRRGGIRGWLDDSQKIEGELVFGYSLISQATADLLSIGGSLPWKQKQGAMGVNAGNAILEGPLDEQTGP